MVDNSKNLFSKIIDDFNPKDENQANDLKNILTMLVLSRMIPFQKTQFCLQMITLLENVLFQHIILKRQKP